MALITTQLMQKIILVSALIILTSFLFSPLAFAQRVYCDCAGNVTDVTYNSESDCAANCTSYCSSQTPGTSGECIQSPSSGTSGSSGGQFELTDPLKFGGDPQELYARIIGALLTFVGVASLVTFVYAGFIFLVSAGNPEKVKKAKDTMLYAIIGIVVAMASYAILSFIFKVLQSGTGN